VVNAVNKDAHALITRAMGINRAARLASCLYFHALGTRLNAVVLIFASNHEIGMAIVKCIHHEASGMFGQAGGEYVRNDA